MIILNGTFACTGTLDEAIAALASIGITYTPTADELAFQAETDNIKNNYTTFDQWLEDCIARGNPNATDIHHIAQIVQSLMGMTVSEIPGHPAHPPHPPHGNSIIKM